MSNVHVTINVFSDEHDAKQADYQPVASVLGGEDDAATDNQVLSGTADDVRKMSELEELSLLNLTKEDPSLAPYYGSLKVKTGYEIQAKLLLPYVTVGKGEFSVLSPKEIAFSGYYSAVGEKGKVDMRLTVTGYHKGTYSFNGISGDCAYKVDGEYLYVYFQDGSKTTYIELQWWHDGLWIGGEAAPYKIWIGA